LTAEKAVENLFQMGSVILATLVQNKMGETFRKTDVEIATEATGNGLFVSVAILYSLTLGEIRGLEETIVRAITRFGNGRGSIKSARDALVQRLPLLVGYRGDWSGSPSR
jgi:hypothetical protein